MGWLIQKKIVTHGVVNEYQYLDIDVLPSKCDIYKKSPSNGTLGGGGGCVNGWLVWSSHCVLYRERERELFPVCFLGPLWSGCRKGETRQSFDLYLVPISI